jgi:predicted transcriptional regulator
MNKIRVLDLTLLELDRQTNKGQLVTIEDISPNIQVEKSSILKALDYLTVLKYCEKTNNAYQITFEGEYFIDKNKFFTNRHPFLLEHYYKKLKIIALVLNTLLVLTLGWLNYINNKAKSKTQIQNSVAEYLDSLTQNQIILKTDTLKNEIHK